MTRDKSYILAALVVAAGLGGGLWLGGGGGGDAGRAMAQNAASATQPDVERRRDRNRTGDDRERRRDRRGNRDEFRDERRSEDRQTSPAEERGERAPAARASAGRQSSAGASAPKRREDFAARFGVVYEKNIFLRDRPTYNPHARDAAPATGPSFTPRRPEESYVLTGIKLQEGRHVAFIENTGGGGGTQRVLIGGAIAGGKVVDLDLDALEYESGGKRTRIEVGRNLAGAVVFTPPAAPPPSSTAAAAARPAGPTPPGGAPPVAGAAPAGAPGGTAIDPNNPNLSVEERMKLRRAQQLGGK